MRSFIRRMASATRWRARFLWPATPPPPPPWDALERITDAILAGKITVPIASVFPIEQIRDAVTMQAGRRVHGKVVVTL
jgi:NADPH:quinone reductase-like Zn-dependent oxidoreductase